MFYIRANVAPFQYIFQYVLSTFWSPRGCEFPHMYKTNMENYSVLYGCLQLPVHGHNHSHSTEATLTAIVISQSLLYLMEASLLTAQTLSGGDLHPITQVYWSQTLKNYYVKCIL